jgi:DNA-binding phage protein
MPAYPNGVKSPRKISQKAPVGLQAVLQAVPVFLSMSDLARLAGVSRTAAYNDINGVKPCPRFRGKVMKLYGIIPWE